MAKTYAGYVKRDVAKDVNWSAVATSISDVLTDSVKEREQKKAAIDKESRELGKRLTDAEGSQHSGLNQFYLDGANSIQEIRRIQDDLLKKGQLSLRDYNVQRQNVVDGVDELLGTVSSYNQLYEEKMKKYDQLSGQDKYQMENIEGFSNFNNHQIYVNPLDGRVSLGKRVMGENGIMRLSEDPNDFMTISSLKNRLNRDILKYDWNENLQQGVDRIGRIKLVINKLGVKTREGQKELENYEKSKTDWIDSMMQDDVHMGSMLSDWIGGYSFNQEKDGDEKTIQLIQDPNGSPNLVPVITKGMKDVIRERLSEEFDARVDKIETAMPTLGGGLTGSERERIQAGQIGYGLALDITKGGKIGETALIKIKSNNPSIDNVYETDDTYVIQYNDGTRDNVIQKIKDGDKEIQEESAVALMAAVNPAFDVTAAQTAKQRYFKGQTPTGLTKGQRVGQRTVIPTQTGATYQTTSSILKQDNKSVAQEINEINPKADKAPQVDAIIKSIQPLPGTENIINNINVTGIPNTFDKDVLKISIPSEIRNVFEEYQFYKDGEVEINYDDTKDKTELNKVIDLILKGMFDYYNAQGQPQTGQAQEKPASAPSGTTAAAKGDSILTGGN